MTYQIQESSLFDWVQATILPFQDKIDIDEYNVIWINRDIRKRFISVNDLDFIYFIFKYLFNVEPIDILVNYSSALFGYTTSYQFKNIKVFINYERLDMGLHVYLTGSACRDYEDLGLDWNTLFLKLQQFNCHYTRIDYSFDIFHDRYFTLDKIQKCVDNSEVVSKFRSSIQFTKDNLISTENVGHTIWFGSRTSDIQFVFYDKLKERVFNANCEIDENIKHWYRLECRFRSENADSIIINYLYASNFNLYMKSVINNYLSFRIKNLNDSRRSRWKVRKWWLDFIDTVDKIKLQKYNVESTITIKKRWLDRVSSHSQLLVLLSDIKDFSADEESCKFIYGYLKGNVEKIDDYDMQIINDYRRKNNLSVISKEDVFSYINDVKDIIILKNNEK